MTLKKRALWVLALATAVALSAATLVEAGICAVHTRPAATLLFPYFEVDLAPANGRNTLVTVINTDDQPVLARMVLWTDLGLPTATFDLSLGANDLQPLNLRQLLVDGVFPSTGSPEDGGSFPSCSFPLTPPALDLAELQAQHTGRPAADGLCWGAVRDADHLAIGYITVDVIRDCSEDLRTPNDPGYFEADGTGLASDRNVLAGDFYLVDDAGDLAAGQEAVALGAGSDYEGFATSFYRGLFPEVTDDRAPLPQGFRTRFLRGGGFDASTDLVLWLGGRSLSDPLPCDDAVHEESYFFARLVSESGEPLASEGLTPGRRLRRITIGNELPTETELPADAAFGFVELRSYFDHPLPQEPLPEQSWVMPLISADGRFSVGVNANERYGVCP